MGWCVHGLRHRPFDFLNAMYAEDQKSGLLLPAHPRMKEMNRRGFLSLAAAAAVSTAGLWVPGNAISAKDDWYSRGSGLAPQTSAGPAIPKWPKPDEIRQVWLQRQETGETVVARYYDGQMLVRDQYIACCSVLRDVQAGSIVHMDLELLDLVFAMQKWLVEWGIDRPLIVHSGYRTPRTNSKEKGKLNSMHLQAKAMDFSIAGIPSEYMGRLASIFGVGGVGFYVGQRGFTHVDTGSVRFWVQRRG
jgi:uncharacterized protein YcbK (DUF882 family)